MNNAARHALGLVAGVVAAPVTFALWCWGVTEVVESYQVAFETSLPGVAALTAGGLLLGVLCGSRVSPLGSLVPGLLFLALGVLWAADPSIVGRNIFDVMPGPFRHGMMSLASTGLALALGVLLLAASVPVSRWRVLQPPPPVPYPQLPFAGSLPGQSAPAAGQPAPVPAGSAPAPAGQPAPAVQEELPGRPVAGNPMPVVPPPGSAPQAPPLPYNPGT